MTPAKPKPVAETIQLAMKSILSVARRDAKDKTGRWTPHGSVYGYLQTLRMMESLYLQAQYLDLPAIHELKDRSPKR